MTCQVRIREMRRPISCCLLVIKAESGVRVEIAGVAALPGPGAEHA